MMATFLFCAIFLFSIQLLPVVHGDVCPEDFPYCSQKCADILSIKEALPLIKGVDVVSALEAKLDKRKCGHGAYCCSIHKGAFGKDDCGQNVFTRIRDSLIVNNIITNSGLTQWPWMASFGYYEQGTWIHKCGGTVITNRHVLTAAQCVISSQGVGQDWLLRIGDNNLTNAKDDHFAVDIEVKEMITHPKYDNETAYFDVAVLEVDGEIEFNIGVQPICLPREPNNNVNNMEGNLVSISGWGQSSSTTGQNSDVLRSAHLAIYGQGYCNSKYDIGDGFLGSSAHRAIPQLFQSNTLCAGYEFGIIGACPGDSGGPLVKFESSGRPPYYVQLATVPDSISKCGDAEMPGIYTRLEDANVLDFIKNTIGAKQSNKNVNKGTIIV